MNATMENQHVSFEPYKLEQGKFCKIQNLAKFCKSFVRVKT